MGIMDPKPAEPDNGDKSSVMLVVKGDPMSAEEIMAIISKYLGDPPEPPTKLHKLEQDQEKSKNWQVCCTHLLDRTPVARLLWLAIVCDERLSFAS